MSQLKIGKGIDVPATAALLGITVLWSVGPLIVYQFSREDVTVWDQNFYRYMIAVSLLWLTVWLKYYHRRCPDKPLSGNLWLRALVPMVPAVIAQVFFVWALYYMQPGLNSILHKQTVVWAAIFGVLFFRDERALVARPVFWLGTILALLGSVGVVIWRNWQEAVVVPEQWLGIVFVVIFSVSWAMYGVTIRYYSRYIDPVRGLGMVMTYTTIVLALLAVEFGEPMSLLDKPLRVWVLLFVSATFNIYIPHMAMYWIIPRLGVTITNTVLLGTALLTVIFSHLIYGETITWMQGSCGLVLILGAAMVLLSQRYMQR